MQHISIASTDVQNSKGKSHIIHLLNRVIVHDLDYFKDASICRK